MKRICLFVCFFVCLFVSSFVRADAGYANMQRTLGGIIQNSVQARGVSLADPRTYNTLYGVGKAAATIAAGAGAGAGVVATAPGWGTVLLGAAVGAGVTYAVNLALDGSMRWFLGTGSQPVGVPVIPTSSGVSPLSPLGNPLGCSDPTPTTPYNACVQPGEPNPMCSTTRPWGCQTMNLCPGQGNPFYPCRGFNSALTATENTKAALLLAGYSLAPDPGSSTQTQKTLSEAFSTATSAQLSQPVGYEAMAAMVNQLWSQASSQPSYSGVPFDPTAPVSVALVQSFAESNPSSYPQVSALASPVSEPSGFAPSVSTSATSAVQPATSTTSSGTTTASTQPATGAQCGASGMSPCAIDGSGLAGQSADISGSLSGVQGAHDNIINGMRTNMPTAPTWNWSLPVNSVACVPFTTTVYGRPFSLNWCPYISVLLQAMSFLAYCLTALYLFKLVTRPAKRA